MSREHRLIELIKQITSENLIGDDCAVLPVLANDGIAPAGGAATGNLLVSSDMLVQDKHFLLPQMKLEDLGWKSLAVNLSDLAAMAGLPGFAVVNIAMPSAMSDDDFTRLYKGLMDCANQYACRIVGGDLTSSEELVISITVLGQASAAGPMLRSGAKDGDLVIVSGDFGASALGLRLILNGSQADADAAYPLKRHLRPDPRLNEAIEIARACAGHGALMDTSDGLADALLQLAKLSGVNMEIEAEKIPIHESTRKGASELGLSALELALYGGEDYELAACVSPLAWDELNSSGKFSQIGRVNKLETLESDLAKSKVLIRSGSSSVHLDPHKTFQHWMD